MREYPNLNKSGPSSNAGLVALIFQEIRPSIAMKP